MDIRSVLAASVVYRSFMWLVGAERFRQVYVDEYVRPRGGDRILDIGCGTADVLAYLGDVEYAGTDMSQRYIDAAKRRFGDRGTFICTRIEDGLEETLTGFDIAIAMGVLHHLPDQAAADLFGLAWSRLKPGGRFVTLDGCYEDGQSWLSRFIISHDRGRHVRTRDGYVDLASRVFPRVRSLIRHDLLRIPYTHIVMECFCEK